jgi:hypothetical protein
MSTHGSAPRVDDEPKTPLWLPALGLAFFVGLAIVWATLPETPPPAAEAAEHAQAATPASAARPPSPPLPPGHP